MDIWCDLSLTLCERNWRRKKREPVILLPACLQLCFLNQSIPVNEINVPATGVDVQLFARYIHVLNPEYESPPLNNSICPDIQRVYKLTISAHSVIIIQRVYTAQLCPECVFPFINDWPLIYSFIGFSILHFWLISTAISSLLYPFF